jgi:hypothetical protein
MKEYLRHIKSQYVNQHSSYIIINYVRMKDDKYIEKMLKTQWGWVITQNYLTKLA